MESLDPTRRERPPKMPNTMKSLLAINFSSLLATYEGAEDIRDIYS